MDLYEQMAGAEASNRGAKIKEPELGQAIQYIVRLDDVKLQESNRGMGTMFIVEFTIVKGTEQTPEGQQYSWVQYPTHRSQTDPGNIKTFVAACLGKDLKADFSPREFQAAIEGAYNNTTLGLTVEQIQTKSGHEFYTHTWRPFKSDFTDKTQNQKPTVPDVPLIGRAPTKEEWLAGEGEGEIHPKNGAYEYHPDNPSWGVRSKK